MRILGISTSHDSGAAVVENGGIIAAVNEERLNREKFYWGKPIGSISECLKISGLKIGDIDKIVFANSITNGGFGFQRGFREGKLSFKKVMADYLSYFRIMDKKLFYKLSSSILSHFRNESELIKFLNLEKWNIPAEYVEHHLCHAASVYYTSPFSLDDRVLIVTVDGSGDGICSAIFTVDRNGFIERRNETTFYHSPASCFYSNITCNLGFKPLRHEGKITGLAAYGNSDKTIHIFRKYLNVDLDRLEYRSRLGCYGQLAAEKLRLLCRGYKREDIAAGLQKRIEEVVSALIREALRRYNCNKICLAGGLFANVRLNQIIFELPEVEDIYIYPHMGDGGISAGAALSAWTGHNLKQHKAVYPQKMNSVYLGSYFSDSEIKKSLEKNSLDYRYFSNVEKEIAELLSRGKVVARFNGRMEYGPRALCNRSILCQAVDPAVNDWLNKRLKRTEFMPFAPVVLFERGSEYFQGFDSGHSFASEFMTITYAATEKCKEQSPAVVHVDGTARPQILRREVNPSMYRILEEYEKITGLPILINTSFNMHEEPIVCTPCDAVRSFRLGHLDILAIGNYIIYN